MTGGERRGEERKGEGALILLIFSSDDLLGHTIGPENLSDSD